ncbi:MAG: hypothetical protein DUD27_01380 [Lachnospiraceae bacterium]|uniref:XRE family transcriptional regulator n=1 Tax=Candidatus Weimeria bifida TaxID=2599074 RepID=A0A6N7IX22_9FIRM|nr:hypothetical protein [Candidatus Weimeria bifida]RRF97241.1 MAG: hypothetical protein DUD27_01380 [Lachnospiraceae bacterium]
MSEKSTTELENVLKSTHPSQMDKFLNENGSDMKGSPKDFSDYFKGLVKEHDKTLSEVFIEADISERYGYKLISGEKRTRQRDVILRLCYAAGFDLDETQKALRLYELPELYVRIPRDALLMSLFNDRVGSVLDVNEYLKSHGVAALRPCGAVE